MKLLHLGDLHLGRWLGDFDLIDDQRYILDKLIALIEEQGIDAVLIAGDVYDRAVPSEAATGLLDDFLSRLAAMRVAVFLISGNHDSDDRLNFGSKLFPANIIYISAKFDGTLFHKTMSDEFGEVTFWLLPFVKASQVRHFYPDANIGNYEDAVRTVIERAEINPVARNVIVAHQFVKDGDEVLRYGGSEGLSVTNVGTVEMIDAVTFADFDYVALGHIHSPQKVGREQVRYAGSPLKYSDREIDNRKSFPIITLGAKGDVRVELKEIAPKRDLRRVRGALKSLLSPEQKTDDYVCVTLTDEDFINDAISLVRQYYPNAVKLDYDNTRTRETLQADISRVAENKTFDELVGDFYRMVFGQEMSGEEARILREVAREEGIVHEAD